MPLSWVHRLGRLAGWLSFRLGSSAARITRRNLQLCFPEKSSQEIEELTLRSLQQTASTGFELGKIWLEPLPQVFALVRNVVGEDLIQAALKAGKGLIFLAPHLGNWELYGLRSSVYAPTTYLYKPPKLDGFETLMTRFRDRGGSNMVPTSRKGVMQLLKALQRGEIVGILPDQEPDLNGGVFAPFFGTDALTMTLASRLAGKTGATVLCGYARRLPDGEGFELVYRAVEPEIGSEDEVLAAAALNRAVERCVREEPAQYQWEYKRFKKRPPNDPRKLYS